MVRNYGLKHVQLPVGNVGSAFALFSFLKFISKWVYNVIYTKIPMVKCFQDVKIKSLLCRVITIYGKEYVDIRSKKNHLTLYENEIVRFSRKYFISIDKSITTIVKLSKLRRIIIYYSIVCSFTFSKTYFEIMSSSCRKLSCVVLAQLVSFAVSYIYWR